MIVLRPGPHTTVQDLGRHGWQRDGVPVGGAMDDVAARIANWLVGNAADAALLEATLAGPAIEITADTIVAVTGADMDARVGGRLLPPWFAQPVRAGETLELGAARTGCRAYLAFAGGIDVPSVLGSRSTYARARLGGLEGRALARGDVLQLKRAPATAPAQAASGGRRGVKVDRLRRRAGVVRVMPGPQLAQLTPFAREAFLGDAYVLTPDSDRMGLRFAGTRLGLRAPVEVLSAGVATGTVQLPPGGEPIVLMADRQTTGGYPRLGEVATVDLPQLAQLRPGDAIRFAEIAPREAELLYLSRERELDRLRRFLFLPA